MIQETLVFLLSLIAIIFCEEDCSQEVIFIVYTLLVMLCYACIYLPCIGDCQIIVAQKVLQKAS